ncbi:MAG: penicillin-binding protein 2 [Candidatus Omnitrophica bacterium]|nr:penicillin-binding protein 2 [Candidatus Omnitrophota bacterium]
MYLQNHPLRFTVVFLFLIFALCFFSVHLVLIQFFRGAHLASLAEKQHNHYIKLEPKRGTIYDRRMRPLAMNITVYSLYANPKMMSPEAKKKAIQELPRILKLDNNFLKTRLSRSKYFVWIARKLSLEEADRIKALKIRGLDFVKESKRYYPNQSLAAHVVGFAGLDNQGLEGLELLYDKFLKGEPGWSQILRDARQRDLLIEKDFMAPKDGFDLVLTIDETIQYIAEKALEKAFDKHNARSATIIVMDPRTGEILALANRPTYNLANFSSSQMEERTNRSIAYVYEPGSVFKIVTAAAALEERTFIESDKIFCENGEYRVANNILHDHHPHGMLSFSEVIEQSSNIGTTKIAQKLGPSKVYEYASRFGFGKLTDIDLKGEVGGVLKSPAQWSKTSIGAVPIGQEVLVTPLQLTTAISVLANNGVLMQPFVVKYVKDQKNELIHSVEPRIVDRVVSEETARRVTKILTQVVERGTGKNAQIKGVLVAGKTGTAQKVVEGQYSHSKFYASFIGYAPADNPRLAAVVVFEEPHPSYFGGTVSAPVFREVIEDALKYLKSLEG